jgi:Protein of unknown function (DUF3408).
MAKRSDGIKKIEDIDEKEFLSILNGRATPTGLPKKEVKQEVKEIIAEQQEIETEEEVILSEEEEVIPEQRSSVKSMSKRKLGNIYEGKFLQPRELKIRQCVYISRGVHETVADIVKRIGDRGLTVGTYIDTIILQHLQENKDEINTLYCKPTDKIIK